MVTDLHVASIFHFKTIFLYPIHSSKDHTPFFSFFFELSNLCYISVDEPIEGYCGTHIPQLYNFIVKCLACIALFHGEWEPFLAPAPTLKKYDLLNFCGCDKQNNMKSMYPELLHSCSMTYLVLYVLILIINLRFITMHCVTALFMLLLVCVQGIISASPGLAIAKSVWAVWTKDWGSPQSSSQSSLWDRRQPRGCQSHVWGTPYRQGESPQQSWCHFPWLYFLVEYICLLITTRG